MSYPWPYPGPVPPETNPPIEPQYYAPSRFVISALSTGMTTLITTSEDHNYVVGQQVRISVPIFYGTFQINGQDGIVISIPVPNQIIVDIDSIGYNAFIPSPSYGPTPPQVTAIGDANTGAINSQGRINNSTIIPGSFIDISPA